MLASNKKYREANRERLRITQNEWVKNNPEKPREIKRRWYLIHTYGITLEMV